VDDFEAAVTVEERFVHGFDDFFAGHIPRLASVGDIDLQQTA
jgi:hypothetical protein